MRVIAGELRSRSLKSIPGLASRPTPDRLRETLFDILALRITGAVFLDAYAGTGAVGIEALSRGARHAFFLERSHHALDVIRENLATLDLESRATVVTGPVLLTLSRYPADIVFADPPYELEREYIALLDRLAEIRPSLAVIQHSAHRVLPETHSGLACTRMVKQGDNILSFYEVQ
ncbi:MAG TPA: 16S rRNA (guanine(966)-N(2))-methyltransferase RsmD [Bryobacteraceae bacterium]|jgi:16S rRNA (guanine(966)-N(2))-methyltransferase RsmD